MSLIIPIQNTSSAVSTSDSARAVDAALYRAEAAERGLAIDDDGVNIADRLASGSFYTPVDVVDHFWREYAGFHDLNDVASLRQHLGETTFVEPAVGAGVFLFGLLRYALSAGCSVEDFRALRLIAIDLNGQAVAFLRDEMARLQCEIGVQFESVELIEGDFLKCPLPTDTHFSFVGNPPYVRNDSSSRWKNLYADFIERMLDIPATSRSLSLIVPISIAFSRDYAALRGRLMRLRAVRLESFDNIPDSLFKVGKPGNTNSNKANSQRCSILTVRDFGTALRQSTSIQRWSRRDREAFLKSRPTYIDFDAYRFDGQIPRPSQSWIMPYLAEHADDITLGELCSPGAHRLAVAGVGRNFVGIREPEGDNSGAIMMEFQSSVQFAWALQILASPVFYEYWRTVGDGFHVTRSDLLRFPISPRLLSACNTSADRALSAWRQRREFSRSKLNAGKEIVSYDFRSECEGLLNVVRSQGPLLDPAPLVVRAWRQSNLPGLMILAE